jgi:hypothetical protein
MSRNVIIKVLLPHRDTISTMLVSPRLSRPKLYISQAKKCMPQVSKQRKNSRFFAVLCRKELQRNCTSNRVSG